LLKGRKEGGRDSPAAGKGQKFEEKREKIKKTEYKGGKKKGWKGGKLGTGTSFSRSHT